MYVSQYKLISELNKFGVIGINYSEESFIDGCKVQFFS